MRPRSAGLSSLITLPALWRFLEPRTLVLIHAAFTVLFLLSRMTG